MKANVKVLAAAVALAASGLANAAIDAPGSAANGGELFLTVWDSTLGNEASFNIGLNLNAGNFNGNGSYTFSNIFSDSVFTANFDANNFLTQSNWKWNVVAADGRVGDGESIVSTSVSSSVSVNNAAVAGGTAQTIGYQANLGACDSCGTNGNINALTYAGSFWGSDLNASVPTINNAGSLGSSLYFFKATDNQYPDYETTGLDPATLQQYAYTWKLDSNGTLTYNASVGAPVPVPAAVWLLGSALVGLVGVARRRESIEA